MQHQYAADVGDFGKFALLRALAPQRSIGIAWYLTSESAKKNDGRYLSYVTKRERFRYLDEQLFDALEALVKKFDKNPKLRNICILEQCGFIKGIFFSDEVPSDRELRKSWAERLRSTFSETDLIFLDPDNGIEGSTLTPKHVALDEIIELRQLRKPLVIYHHQGRTRGGAPVEASILTNKMRSLGCKRIEIIRLRPYSSRFYIVIDHDDLISRRLSLFRDRWRGLAELY